MFIFRITSTYHEKNIWDVFANASLFVLTTVQLVYPFIYLTQVLEQKIQILIKTIQMILNVPAARPWGSWGTILVEKEEIAFSF